LPDIIGAGSEALKKAEEVFSNGGCFAFPTDTVYGLGCDPRNEASVLRIFQLKRRMDKPLPILCSNRQVASSLVDIGIVGNFLAQKFWPGPLTIVAPKREPSEISEKVSLGRRELGVRVPNHGFCLKLLGQVGGLLVGTSANISGFPSARSRMEVSEYFGNALELIIDGGELPLGVKESTVVSLEGEEVRLVREGSISTSDLRSVLSSIGRDVKVE
jgi:L-threonylcarbamoyladenylate synthase